MYYLNDGMELLALGEDPLRERLARAYTRALIHVDAVDLPDALRTEWEELKHSLTRVPGVTHISGRQEQGAVNATTAAMTDEEARDAIRRIFALVEQLMLAFIPRR